MVFTDDGLKNIRKWLAQSGGSQPEYIMVGTDGTTPTITDSSLYSPIDSTKKTFETTPIETDFTIQYEHALSSLEANGFALKEFALLDSSSSSIYTRDTFPTLSKTDSFEVQTLITVKLINEGV